MDTVPIIVPTTSDILTIQELHRYLKVPTATLYTLAQDGRIPAAKIGRHWRFRRADIDGWIQAQHRASPARAAASRPPAGRHGKRRKSPRFHAAD